MDPALVRTEIPVLGQTQVALAFSRSCGRKILAVGAHGGSCASLHMAQKPLTGLAPFLQLEHKWTQKPRRRENISISSKLHTE